MVSRLLRGNRANRANQTALAAAVALIGGLVGVGAVGCGPSAETQEARRVLQAINVLRDAPTEPLSARETLVGALEQEQTNGPIAARAKDACTKAYRLLIQGKTLEASVEKQLATPGTASLDTLRDLAAAEEKIKESAQVMPDCDRATSELRLGPASGR